MLVEKQPDKYPTAEHKSRCSSSMHIAKNFNQGDCSFLAGSVADSLIQKSELLEFAST